ncbi:MAG: hypothetical protein R3F41_12295 [Gammaproteobacteria bacterium]|nr:hypothetical protein [Pseudomonadales bacterium]MCP5348876.1 hypothetical protein [Pseudomonadales bacterium]
MEKKVTPEDMISDPSDHFNHPIEVLQHKKLTMEQKQAILESWKVDEQEISTATAENMGKTDNNRLSEVIDALQKLTGKS